MREAPETDRVWADNTMNILEWAKQLERERDEAIGTIRAEAKREVERLDGLDAKRVDELAKYVVERLVGSASGGRL